MSSANLSPRPSARTRLTDLAEVAGVSTATVSRVLNGKSNVSDETRAAVLRALDQLGYERPERLRRASAGLVGLVVPELSNPVFPALAQVIESQLQNMSYTPLLCTQSPGGTTEDEYVEILLKHGVDGIVFVSGLHADTQADHTRYTRLREAGVPIVLVGGYTPGVAAPFVSADDVTAADLAVRHLVSLGHTRIGLAVGPRRFVPTQRKVAGFSRALQRHGLAASADEVEEHVVSTLFSVEGGQAAANELVATGHTAIVCASDLMALGAIRAVEDAGLDVPGDVSVVGYDDSPLIAFTSPPLTTVRQPVAPMGRAAVAALMAVIRGEQAPRAELLFRPELVVRESTGAAPTTARARGAGEAVAGLGSLA